ncbi:reverse transcriptase family protein [Lactiplantibacillus plantarum]|uniref:reverse transcriptase family protein n=3 Tax=Lactiplantibacillus plantarum TaxID=1590 RepID=UPI000DAC8E36|nr:reverse transcriptase family protein [Lactiplantibacillus plantarum]KAF1280884.1 hypothetical protein CHF38_15310 [Lactiplantibacillus plantarum]RAH93760.1 hypothetical protein DAY22_15315 [Lactiplantibacillus plantarum]
MKLKNTNQIKKLFKITGNDISSFVTDNIASEFKIKKSNKERIIVVPSLHLKSIFRWLLDNIFEKEFIPHECVHGFVKNKSIVTNAKAHLYHSPNWVYTIDINNFFGSITRNDVLSIFIEKGWPTSVANAFADLCTYKNTLPQGFPTSPCLANAFLNKFDTHIHDFCKTYGIRYTRYADDLTFSSTDFVSVKKINEEVSCTLKKQNLFLNPKKEHLQKGKHKKITGININGHKLVSSRRFRKKFDNEIFFCKKYGIMDHLARTGTLTRSNFKSYMYGKACFINMIDQDLGQQYFRKLQHLNWPEIPNNAYF